MLLLDIFFIKVYSKQEDNKLSCLVAIAQGVHLFPFRTEKLSLVTPMVLHGRLCGRVGSCQASFNKKEQLIVALFCFKVLRSYFLSSIFFHLLNQFILLKAKKIYYYYYYKFFIYI